MSAADTSYRPGVDVVVVNYRTPGDLAQFVASLRDSRPGLPYSLYVANVEPTREDEAVALSSTISEENGGQAIRFDENVGYARAVNRAVSCGDREIVAIFNADVRINEGSLDDCALQLLGLNHEDWGALGPRQVDQSGLLTHAGIVGTNTEPEIRGWRRQDRGQFKNVDTNAVSIAGSAYFIRREVWDAMASCPTYVEIAPEAEGAFLPTPFYYEETWLSYHLRAHGLKVVYYGPSVMVHHWHGAVRQNHQEGWAARQYKISQAMFREACEAHGIDHD